MNKKEDIKVIYEILKKLQELQDNDLVRYADFSYEIFKISENRFNRLIGTLLDTNLVAGFIPIPVMGKSRVGYKLSDPRLTLNGINYLSYYSAPETFLRRVQQINDLLPI